MARSSDTFQKEVGAVMPEATVPMNEVPPIGGEGHGNGAPTQTSATAAAPAMTPQVQAAPKKYYATIFPGPQHPVPDVFAEKILALESTLGMPLWLFVQNEDGPGKYDEISEVVRQGFWSARSQMPAGSPIALLIDSPGGYARNAYQIATLLRRHCGEFTAVVPRLAKSAATLLALGAGDLIMNSDAELGPLDVQIFEPDREEWSSALNEVQTVERLQAASLLLIDQVMMLLVSRTRKKVDTVLPHVLKFTADMMRPMFENIDVVHFTQRARDLKVAEEYAIRLLRPRYTKVHAELIARRLVSAYPDHSFVIDAQETNDPELNLETTPPTDEQVALMDTLVPLLGERTVLGRLEEITP